MNLIDVKLNGNKCPFCSRENLRKFAANAYDVSTGQRLQLLECQVCDVAWQWPVLRSEIDSRFYFQRKYQDKESDSYFDSKSRSSIAALQVDFLDSLDIPRGELLDIGAGDGVFVAEAAKRGWQAVGVEPAECSSILPYGAEMIQGTLTDLALDRRFDVITMWDVIEHVESPIEILSAACRFLKEDGWLIVETGNYQSAGRIEEGDSWWCYQLDHRWYLSPEALIGIFTELGFRSTCLAKRVLRPWWKGDSQYLGPALSDLMKNVIRSPVTLPCQVRRFKALRRASVKWERWSGLPIITIAAYGRVARTIAANQLTALGNHNP